MVEIRLAPQSWSTWGRLACLVALLCAIVSLGSKPVSNICRVTCSLYVCFVSKGLHVSHLSWNQQAQRVWKTYRRYNHNMSQRTSLTFWCFILGLVPLHGHSAHLRPIFGRVQAKILWFLCMTNLKTSGEHLLLPAAPWSRSLSGIRQFFTSQIPRMKDHTVVTIVAENCHEITECSCCQTGIRQKLKSLVQQPLPHGSATLAKHVDMHRASKRGSYLARVSTCLLSERNSELLAWDKPSLRVSRCHTYLTSQCLSHATHPWKAVKAGHAQHFPVLAV